MPPKGSNAPKPVAFSVAHLQAGKRKWEAGASGPMVKLDMRDHPFLGLVSALAGCATTALPIPQRPRREVILLGKVLFGRQRFAFEIQELDYAPASIQKLLDKEKEIKNERFGGGGFFGGFGFEERDSEIECPNWLHLSQARELAAKHSLQVKFEDIQSIEMTGDTLTLSLAKAPQCYVKPAGEGRVVNMEVCKDITNGAKTIVLNTAPPPGGDALLRRDDSSKTLAFPEVRQLLMEQSPHLAALFRGLPPLLPALVAATPRRNKRAAEDELAGSTAKRSRPRDGRQCQLYPQPIVADAGTWLKKVVDRFGLSGPLDGSISEEQWRRYLEERVAVDAEPAGSEENSEEDEELEDVPTAVIQARIRASVKATMASTALTLDPKAVAKGVYLTDHDVNDADEGEPRTVTARALIYSPLGNNHVVHIFYENHCRVRSSFTERFSYMYAFRSTAGSLIPPLEPRSKKSPWEKLFDLDFDECRRKNQVKTSVATNATLTGLGAHLFGAEGAVSNRKVFGLLLRAGGLGQYKENNGWPVAVMRRRFKCGKGESETDVEGIAGDKDEEPSIGGCCVM